MNQALIITSSAFYAFLGGVLISLIWLWFWLKEDPHPEPRKTIIRTFIAGIAVLPFALILEELVFETGSYLGLITKGFPFLLLFLWAGIEEYAKYAAARWAALKRPGFTEPMDAPIYLLTAALGFAALENSIFLFKAFKESFEVLQGPALGLITGQLRFLGATLLHITTSGIVGVSISYSFFHREHMRRNIWGGLFTATLLHALFNFFIIEQGGEGVIGIFIAVWAGVIALIFIFERIKRLKP